MTGSGDWVRVHDFPSRDDASAAGARLLESGIVAMLEDGDDVTGLAVLPADVERACELLGVAVPETPLPSLDEPLPPDAGRWRLPREHLPWFVLGYLVVLVALGVIVFFVVAWLLGAFDSTELPNTTLPPP